MRCIIAIVVLFSVIMISEAQEQSEPTYTIVYWTSQVSDATPEIAAAFLDNIQQELQEYDLTVDIVRWHSNIENPDNGDVILYFYEHFNGERVIIGTDVRVEINARNMNHLSPILEENRKIFITLIDENAEKLTTGLVLYTTGKIDEAQETLQDVQRIEQEYRSLDFYLGNIAILNGNFDEAIAYFEDEIWSSEGRFLATNLVWALFQTDRRNEAFLLLNDTIQEAELYTDFTVTASLYSLRAQLYALAFDYHSAIADMDTAIELAEANEVSDEYLAELYTLRGEIIFLIYEWDRVLENFNIALELNSEYAPAYFQRGVLYYTMTERESALTDFQHYLEIAPDGEHAAAAQRYVDSIQLELESLGG
jgi:tetratricopeptide (TPR) repeat protein